MNEQVRIKPGNNPNIARLKLIRPYAKRLTLGFMVMMVTVLIQLAYPKAIAYFIDNASAAQDPGWLSLVAMIMFIVIIIQTVVTSLRYYIFTSTGSMIVTQVRRKLYSAIIRQEIAMFDRSSIGELTNRLSSDVEILHNTLSIGLTSTIQTVFIFVGGSIMLILLSPELSLLILFTVPPTILITKWIGNQVSARSKATQEKLAKCGKLAQETFLNIRLVRAFIQEKREEHRYAAATGKALDETLVATRLLAGFQGLGIFIQSLSLVITLWYGGTLMAEGTLSVGDLAGFILYTGMISSSAAMISTFWGDWMKSIGATERVFDLLSQVPQALPVVTANEHQLEGGVKFENISFSYPTRKQQQALQNFTLKVAPGEKIALVGPSGAGKSTVASLILGFYLPDSGTLKFDGLNVEELNISDIRKHVAIVEQEPSLFSCSIADNIRYAALNGNISQDDIIIAAKHANAHNFISSFPDGYDTLLGDRGVQLSGGQKQRIAIARALLRDPKILILDEATSALDSDSENQVQAAIEHLMQGRSTIIIAHRFSTIINADRVIVMRGGCIIQDGKHDQLITNRNGLYYHLMKDQVIHQKSAYLL